MHKNHEWKLILKACFNPNLFSNEALQTQTRFRCALNNGVLNKPVKDKCGHAFCSICIEEYIRENKCCPISKKPIESINELQEDLWAQERIMKFQITCHLPLCKWIGNLCDFFQKHIIECGLANTTPIYLYEIDLENSFAPKNSLYYYFQTLILNLRGKLDTKYRMPFLLKKWNW